MKMIDAKTHLYGVMGDPISHSLSPIMQQAAFDHYRLNAVYLAFRTARANDAMKAVRSLEIRGVSVTIPNKVSVVDHLDEVDDTAAKIGAVNTVINRNGRLSGFNTDCEGAVSALSRTVTLMGKRVVVLGAGGAARAVGFGVIAAGAEAIIVNRTPAKGRRLARDLGCVWAASGDLAEIGWDVLVNTTPVGMHPHTDASPVAAALLRPGAVVMDAVYNPIHTRLLAEAEMRGCRIIDGVSMFVGQGAGQFELWTGKPAPLEIMRNAVLCGMSSPVASGTGESPSQETAPVAVARR
jgi:shikimate dehydrogenase